MLSVGMLFHRLGRPSFRLGIETVRVGARAAEEDLAFFGWSIRRSVDPIVRVFFCHTGRRFDRLEIR
jgi:hypothetical protein